jgi:CheY-like chemotaxis protein
LLAFSRKQILIPAVLDLNVVVSDMQRMLQRLIGEHIEFVFKAAGHLDSVRADPGQIGQVVMNLVVNARDAMPNGGVLTIETRNVLLDAAFAAEHPSVGPGPHVLEGPVHLMLTDVVMPGMSGWELAAHLESIRPRMKVLYTSGYPDDAFLRHGVADASGHFLAKPYTIDELTRKVREVLDSPS